MPLLLYFEELLLLNQWGDELKQGLHVLHATQRPVLLQLAGS